MIEWPPNLSLPSPALIHQITVHLCGEDKRGQHMTTEILAVFAAEVYHHPKWTVTRFAKAIDYHRDTLVKSYMKHGQRRRVRIMALTVYGEAVADMRLNAMPSRFEEHTPKEIARAVLRGNLGRAV